MSNFGLWSQLLRPISLLLDETELGGFSSRLFDAEAHHGRPWILQIDDKVGRIVELVINVISRPIPAM